MSTIETPTPNIAAMVASGTADDADARRLIAEALASLWVETPTELVGKLSRYVGSKDTPKGQRTRSNCEVCGSYHEMPAIHLDYLGHADTTMLVARVDPFWQWEPRAGWDEWGEPRFIRDRNGYPIRLWIDLTILGVTRPGVGTVGTGKDDPEKELIGDAIRNAAMRFGVGADLWSKARGAASLEADPGDEERTDDPSRYARHAEPAPPSPEQLRHQQFLAAWEEEGMIDGRAGRDAYEAAVEEFSLKGKALDPAARERYKAAKEAAGIPWPPTPAELRRLERMLEDAAAFVEEPCDECGAPAGTECDADCPTKMTPEEAAQIAADGPAGQDVAPAAAGPETPQEVAAAADPPETPEPVLEESPECITDGCDNAAEPGSEFCSDHEPF